MSYFRESSRAFFALFRTSESSRNSSDDSIFRAEAISSMFSMRAQTLPASILAIICLELSTFSASSSCVSPRSFLIRFKFSAKTSDIFIKYNNKLYLSMKKLHNTYLLV